MRERNIHSVLITDRFFRSPAISALIVCAFRLATFRNKFSLTKWIKNVYQKIAIQLIIMV